jgi:hypothetical protein
VVNADRVAAADKAFGQTPGDGGRVRCNGVLHADGTAILLHVVNLVVV